MRARIAVVLISIFAITLIGQEDPLPSVHARGAGLTVIDLAVEPFHEVPTQSLAAAARANDYPTFDALYKKTKDPRFATLHELWTYSIADPIGAFYGTAMHDQLAKAYPGYAAYIAQFRIVDDHGNVFYPTSETRAFLLARAEEGITPRTMLAAEPKPRTPITTSDAAGVSRRSTASTPAKRKSRTTRPSEAATAPAAAAKRLASTQRAPVPARAETTEVVSTKSTAAASSASAPSDHPVDQPSDHPAVATPAVATPVVTTPVVTTPVVTTPVVTTPVVTTPVVTTPVVTPSTPPPAVATNRTRGIASRGILLVIIGLLGVGVLAVILRTPREEEKEREATNVKLIRPADAPPRDEKLIRPADAPPRDEKPRATGSRG